ncbi:DUF4097 and DUF4098 domain-containing protein YvlB [Stackebrandtia endophytica]|uniref:DUF4097 and DUF4098 domain-containing protein YvlB n=1 Tax=Stackebrandtia endophytica TaxID=1496996 RepID=A0A543B248_9ACTN|nr:DUF4097 family beta strand repeat-containing protein [Stackebrandtia endophytica]TQL78915.1 DUF4097 and DUF4098 domain-containing protein YvlB [Stackebrandtia endophytica]
MSEFPCDGPISVNVLLAAGRCEIIAEDRDSATVEVTPHRNDKRSREAAEATRVDFSNNKLTVQAPEGMAGMVINFGRSSAIDVAIRVPRNSSANVKSASAPINLSGEYDVVQATTASGEITVEKAADASVNTASGDIRVTECSGNAKGNTVSGDLQLDWVGNNTNLKSVSGDVRIGYAGGSVSGGSVSGDITINTLKTGNCQLKSVSGSVSIGIAPGTGVWMDLNTVSGSTSSDLPVGDLPTETVANVELRVGTVSGNIDLFRSGAA